MHCSTQRAQQQTDSIRTEIKNCVGVFLQFSMSYFKALEDKGFDNLTAHDLDELKIKKSHIAVIREAAKTLQIKHGESPLQTQVTTDHEDMAGPNLVGLLRTLAITATMHRRWVPSDH